MGFGRRLGSCKGGRCRQESECPDSGRSGCRPCDVPVVDEDYLLSEQMRAHNKLCNYPTYHTEAPGRQQVVELDITTAAPCIKFDDL